MFTIACKILGFTEKTCKIIPNLEAALYLLPPEKLPCNPPPIFFPFLLISEILFTNQKALIQKSLLSTGYEPSILYGAVDDVLGAEITHIKVTHGRERWA